MLLSGNAKEHWSICEGEYVLQSMDINGYLSWKHEKGNIWIWYNINYGCWCIAPAENCGTVKTQFLEYYLVVGQSIPKSSFISESNLCMP